MAKAGPDTTGKISKRAREKQLKKIADQRIEPLRSAARARITRLAEDRLRSKAIAKQVTREQRELRKRLVEVRDKFKPVANHDGTPETRYNHSRKRPNALQRAYERGDLDDDQLAYAHEIASVAELIKRDVSTSTASLEGRVDVCRFNDGTIIEGLRLVRFQMAYTMWRSALPAPKALVLDMIQDDPLPYSSAARLHGVGHKKARQRLIQALDAWPDFLQETLAIKREDVDLAHARLNAA